MSNRIQEVNIDVIGQLDQTVSINLVEIENQILKDKYIDTSNWEGIPDDYVIGSIDIYHNQIDFSNWEIPVEDIDGEVFEQVRDELFTFVGTDNEKTKYWYIPISKEVV